MDQNILIKRGITSIQHLSKINVIIVSVNYNDFLPITLENNIKIFDSITVVTSINDKECQKICQKFNVNCVVTERMYDNGASFNKGKAINEGIKSLLNPNWILLLDADIIVPETFTESFKNNYTNINSLYVCNRIMFKEYQSYLDWKSGSGAKGQVSKLNGIGYFQLFNINSKCLQRIIYPETSNNAAGSDISFRNKFTEKVDLEIESTHLGIPYQNWNGRKTPDFITTSENTQSIQKVNSKKKYKICSYYFNLKNNPRLKNNFLRFIKQFEGRYENLIVGLVDYGDIDFELPCETIIIKGDVDNKIWSKEIIINKVIDTIDDVDYLMWIDGDLIYDDLSWLDNIDDVVKDKDFVQLFENVNYLNENEQISKSYKSICFKLKNDLKPMNSSKISKYESKSDFKPGLSWLGKFSILKEKKIFEKMYTGDGDVIFLYGINGVNEGLTLNRIKELNLEIHNEAIDWINSFGRYSLGYLNQTINHLYHGEITDRDYIKRGRYKELLKLKEVTKIKYKEFDLNTYFDKIYCLNLKKRENRWIYSNYQFINNNISVERFDAIDGELIDFNNEDDINLESLSRKGVIENKGALGCLKSHLEIIKDAKSKNYKRILIFEDDILLSDNFNEEVKKIKDIDWNLLYLGASQFEWSNIKPENELYKCSKTLGTFAYALDISIYDEVLKIEQSYKKSIDNILSDIQKFNDKCYTFFPNIVISDVSESDIRSPKSIVEYSKKVKWDLDKFKKYYDKKYLVETELKTEPLTESVLIKSGKKSESNNFEVVNISLNKGKKVLFLIYFNDVGGAEYVSYQHIKVCKELGYKPIVLSAGKGMFFDKIKDLDVDLFYSNIDNLDENSTISLLDTLSEGCEIIYNCNYFEITKYIYFLKKIKSFKYYTITHSDIEWIIDSISKHDEITDKYIVIHDKIRKELNNKNICNTKIVTIPNYIDFDNIYNNYISFNNKDIKIKYGIEDNDFIIGMISRISPDKNIIDALKVIKKTNIPNIKLLIVGDSSSTKESISYKETVLKKINELGLNKKVIITGHVDNNDIYKFISCFNTSINTSPSEGLPISLLEQMACGLHSIFPSHGEIPDVLEGYGSVINLKQKKSFNKLDIDNYIYSGYSDSELNLFVDEINRVYNNIKVDKEKISNHIKLTRSSESIKYYLDYLFGGYKKGVSFIIRARNEEVNVSACLESISNIADEIIFVDHLSTDNTYKIAFELSKKHSNIKVFKYKSEVPRPGDNYNKNISVIGNSISNYYNFCLTKATKYNVIKWDADFLPNTENLINMIDSLDLKNRKDKFSLWFTGETMFIDNGLSYINKNSYYDEYRAFSLLNGVKWEDAIRCEHIDPNYIEDSIKIRYELPCFYEIKRTDINEFELRDSLIDKRDVDDHNIINNLKQGIITKNLKRYEI